MLFGGLQQNSFIDYPGKISCVLFLAGCNFKCPYCHNPDLALKPKDPVGCMEVTENKTLFEFLNIRKGFLDGVVISGGEPTLQKDLPFLCRKIKQMNYPVKLDTNGSRPDVIQMLIEQGLVDYLAMDIKTAPDLYPDYIHKNCHPDNIISSTRIIMESGLPYEFRTTCLSPIVTLPVIKTICRMIRGSDLYALQQFRETEVLDPGFFKDHNCLYSKDDLMDFKTVADPMVKKCVVR